MYRFENWPLRTKMAVLLVVASLLPLAVATTLSIRNARAQLLEQTDKLLTARSDQLMGRIDTFVAGYQRAVTRMAQVPTALELLQASSAEAERLKPAVSTHLGTWPATDSGLRGVAVLNATGKVLVGTEAPLIGVDLAYRSFVKEALLGKAVTSDVYLAEPEVGSVPTIAFLAPMRGSDGKVVGVAAFWVRAATLSDVLRESNDLAGPGSFAILFDQLGIRMAHSFDQEIVFHPGVQLEPAVVAALVAERRFGARTRELLADVRAVSEDFQLTAPQPPHAMFRGYAPGNKQWNYVIARRFSTVAWSSYYLIPESVVQTEVARMTRQKLLFLSAIVLMALLGSALFAAVFLTPIRALSAAARDITGGNPGRRVTVRGRDELGQLGATFNTMAERLQEQAEQLREENEAQYRNLFEAMTEGFCTIEVMFDAAGKAIDYLFLDINPAFVVHTGMHNAVGRTMRELGPDLEANWYEIFGRVALTGDPVQFENYAKPLGRYYEVRAFRVGGAESRKVAMVFADITGRKTAEQRREAQLERLHMLHQITRAIGERQDLASIYQVVIRTLEDQLPIDFGCFCLYEPADNRLTVTSVGLHSQELALELAMTEQAQVDIDENGLSRCVRGKLVYEPDVSLVQFPFPQRLASAGLRALVAAPLLVESKVFGVLIAARREAGSFSSGECEFLRQLSEHVALAANQAQLYSALQIAYDDLRHTQQAAMQQERLRSLGQMASGIAHDINNAISPVALYTDSLLEREPNLTPQGRGQLETIQRAIHDVAATVARMREFYRQREPQLLLAPVQLNDLVPHVVDLTRARWSAMAQRGSVTIHQQTQLAADLPVIMGAEGEIREALTNLVLNAVDAMPQGGTLTLRTRFVDNERVQVEVSDTGVGMDEDARRRCLEPFFTTKGERGTGLGLAMVYGMVQRHSAEVEIESAPGRGTTVRLSFAASQNSLAPEQATMLEVPTGLRLLVVDDDPVLLRTLRDTLEADGHVVITASGGQEGIDLFRKSVNANQPFSAVITDLGMPYVDGRQVASALKRMSSSTPVIMLTGWGQRLVAEGDIPANVDMVLNKPPKLRDLREALAQFCGSATS